jgi:hypothetical protein
VTTEVEPTGATPFDAPLPDFRTSGYAIAALVVGLFPTLGIGSVLAIVFGIRARHQIDADVSLKGHGMATAGVVLGVIGLILNAGLWLLAIVAVVSGASG